MYRPFALAATILASVGVVASCSAGGLLGTPEARSADHHATVAGEVMVRDNWERSANDAAYLVVGRGGDDTIDALEVDGTTYHGTVILRITVDEFGESGDGPAVKCYAYTFRHQEGDQNPADVPCNGEPVALSPPVPEPAFDPAAAARLNGILHRLVARHTTDAETIRRQVAAAFGPPVTVRVGGAVLDHGTNHGTIFVSLDVPSQWECMWAYLTTTGQITTGTGNRRQCAN